VLQGHFDQRAIRERQALPADRPITIGWYRAIFFPDKGDVHEIRDGSHAT
jgi:hypothetical protein